MTRRIYATTPLVLGMLALAACPSDDVSIDTEGTTAGTTEDPTTMGSITTPMTTTPDPDTTAGDPDTTDGDVCEPACEAGRCCVGGACFTAPEPVCPGNCGLFEVCQCPEGSDPCDCEASCVTCGTEGGGYESCLDADCPAGSVCVLDDPTEPTFGWCAPQGCGTDDCACPLPAEGATAVPSCGEFDGDEGGGSCFLDCSANDAVCPDGMICRPYGSESVCVWPGEGIESTCCFANGGAGCDDATCQMTVCAEDAYCCDTEWDGICVGLAQQLCGGLCPLEGDIQPQYGDCINLGPCEVGTQCISDQAGTFGWCGTIGCMDDTPCQPPPGTGDAPAVCAPINDTTDACLLDCSMGQTCPDGMTCLDGFSVCVWTELLTGPGYGPCVVPDTGCSTGQTCLDDGMMDPAWEVCVQEGCTDVAECTLDVPTTGTAPVACGDPTGAGANACYLDCSAGQTCPDGMACIDDALCGWPAGTEIFGDDFQDGDLTTPAWTLYDEDGLAVDMNVGFVNAAWVASDAVESPNFTAIATSWYMPAGQSDDWMVTPQLMLGANPRLSWASRSVDPDFPDGLEVLVSATGNTPADFTDPPVLVDNPASGVYVGYGVSLAAYANQSVYIAFRSVANDGFLLLVDNVSVQNVP